MCTSKSKEVIEYYEKVFTIPDHPTEDDFTAHLTLYAKEICSGIELNAIAKPAITKLTTHGVHNRRLNWIIRYCVKMFEAILASPASVSETHLASLRLIGLILRHVHTLGGWRSGALLELLGDDLTEPGSGNEPKPRSSKAARKLCELLLEYATHVKLDVKTVITHAEVASLLLSMCSSTLHHPTSVEETPVDMFVEMILNYECLEVLVGMLLRRIIEWHECPDQMKPLLYNADQKLNLTKLFSWFMNPQKDANRTPSEKAEDLTNPMLRASCSYWELTFRHLAQLLALLVIYQRGNRPNPVVEHIKTLKDGQVVRFPALLEAIVSHLPNCPSLCTLLYVFFYDHDSFLQDVIASDYNQLVKVIQSLQNLSYVVCINADSLVTLNKTPHTDRGGKEDGFGVYAAKLTHNSSTLEHLMYVTTQFSYPFICFMASTLLLILSQNFFLGQQVFRVLGRQTLPLRRYSSHEITVGASYLIVVAVGVGKALKDHNEQLAMLYASCMNNLAFHARDIDSYTSQRLLMLLVVLLKRLQLLEREYQQATIAPGEKPFGEYLEPDSTQPNAHPHDGKQSKHEIGTLAGRSTEEIECSGKMYLYLLDAVVVALETMLLRDPNSNNECLIYELLYHRDKIITSSPSKDQGTSSEGNSSELLENSTHFMPCAQSSLSGLCKCILKYEAELANAPNASRQAEVIHIIRRYNQSQGSSKPTKERFKRDNLSSSLISAGSHDNNKSLMRASKNSASVEDISEGTKTHEIAYVYEESPHSYDFFAPFVWSTMLNDARLPGGILWCTDIKDLGLFLS